MAAHQITSIMASSLLPSFVFCRLPPSSSSSSRLFTINTAATPSFNSRRLGCELRLQVHAVSCAVAVVPRRRSETWQQPQAAGGLEKAELIQHSSSSRGSLSLSRTSSSSFRFASLVLVKTSSRGTRNNSSRMDISAVSPELLQWAVFVAAVVVLLKSESAGIRKHYVMPLIAIDLPRQAINLMKSELGLWAAFLGLFGRYFLNTPREFETPLNLLLLINVIPARVEVFRGTAIAAGASLGITCILAHQYYQSIGSLKNAFRSGTVLVTIALLVLFGISAVLLLQAGA
ncbi:unnamed protein product [Sphagnum troendelagicum]|uniref:Uncharacterized protein n=1 Tax=Sphagnum troendelagicum TaxID=128251 RepID=A0ABP0UR17_9BRYO